MAAKRSTPEQTVAKLRQVEVLTAQGKTVAEAVRAIGVTEPTYYRWRAEYGGLKPDGFVRSRANRPCSSNFMPEPGPKRARLEIFGLIPSSGNPDLPGEAPSAGLRSHGALPCQRRKGQDFAGRV